MDKTTQRISEGFLLAMDLTAVMLTIATAVPKPMIPMREFAVYASFMIFHITSLAAYLLLSYTAPSPQRHLIAHLVGSVISLPIAWVFIVIGTLGSKSQDFRYTNMVFLPLCWILELLHYFTFHLRETEEGEEEEREGGNDMAHREMAVANPPPPHGRYTIKKTIDVEAGKEVLVLYYTIYGTCTSKGLVKTRTLKEGDPLPETCAICMDEFKIGDSLVTCQCKKSFHTPCILDWADTCPNCIRRGYLVEPEVIDA